MMEERASYRPGGSGTGARRGHRVVEYVGCRECHDLSGGRRRGGGRRHFVWNGISLALVQLPLRQFLDMLLTNMRVYVYVCVCAYMCMYV